MSDQLISLLRDQRRRPILVVGDVMLDRYLWGDVERISPEAPIPILRVGRQEDRVGGAGSVATMLAALGAEVTLATVTGDDREGRTLRELLEATEVDGSGVLSDPQRATTVKQRLLGSADQRHPHHMMRVDREDDHQIGAELAERLLEQVGRSLEEIDLILISDYKKGVCQGDFVPRLVELARPAGVPVLADPVRGVDYHRYAGCACVTPNRTEAGMALGTRILAPDDALEAARQILQFGVDAACVTMDRDGIAWADRQGNVAVFPVRSRQVCDVTGAGDMVLAALGYCLAAGAAFPLPVEMANLAGSLEVQRLGAVPLSRGELLAELSHGGLAAGGKILSTELLKAELARRRRCGQQIAMTNGCFDLLHPGHIASLEQARRQGDCLVVGLNSDQSVRKLKGEGRPIVDQQGRAEMLAALECVDFVVLFDEASVAGLVERLRPDVLVKSAQYTVEQVVGHQIVRRYGGRVVTVPVKPSYSTTQLIEKIHSISSGSRKVA